MEDVMRSVSTSPGLTCVSVPTVLSLERTVTPVWTPMNVTATMVTGHVRTIVSTWRAHTIVRATALRVANYQVTGTRARHWTCVPRITQIVHMVVTVHRLATIYYNQSGLVSDIFLKATSRFRYTLLINSLNKK